jgi:hypothetical protein
VDRWRKRLPDKIKQAGNQEDFRKRLKLKFLNSGEQRKEKKQFARNTS